MENINIRLTYGALFVLALGLLTSMSVLALSHILIIVPALYLLPKIQFRNLNKSTWALLAFSLMIVLSVLFNQDIAVKGYKPLPKVKYFLFGFLMIFPFSYYLTKYFEERKISILLYVFCTATTIATIAGIVGMFTEYNFIGMRFVNPDRNHGLFGMLMNYAHNMIFFQVIVLGMVLYRKSVEKFINLNFLYIVFGINLIGLYLTYTRGAWLGFLAAIPFFFFKHNLKKFVGIILALALLGAGAFFFAGESIVRPKSDDERMSQWKAAGMAFKERPILGYGYLNFEEHSTAIKKRYGFGELKFGGHAHNNFLEILASTGILGFIAYVLWLIFWFIEMFKRHDVIGNIGLPFIIAFVVGGLTQSTISLGINLFFVMAVYAVTQVKKDYFI